MSILFRYLAREIYAATALVLVAFLGLFAFFDFINELEDVGKGDYQIVDAAVYVVLILPGRVYELFPVAVLIGTLYALATLARHSEITVMRASGLSNGALMRVLGLIGSVLVALTFLIGEYVAPPAESAAQEWKLTATKANVSQQLRSGLWVKDGALVINVRTMLPDRTMQNARVYEFDADYALVSISEAKRGVHDGKDYWRLLEVSRTRFLDDRTEVEHVPEITWRSDLSPEVLGVLMVAPEHMPLAKLWTYIQHLRDNQQSADRFEIALWKKLIYPFAVLVMMALALPFGFIHDRMGGASARIFMGVMLGVGFHLLNGLFSNLGMINAWPPIMAALTPSLIFLAAAAGILHYVERR
ncbi:LPS export ABC transporter permease LptG [Thauera linaloolentis]|uniref:Permease YjgP/YjgQ family protein n=1 Tax=Thauera linaloolentis (strain DSM 12138 / JCM 21573 / CCUG 41526 / CIP 105981 / IAM 15112 / NBRC 102519 / 47Lol) TaxID=1123367 RepID=N6YVZ0_THAL4|nr:LPS export ABC transporter permease LptG [Thauera linaloolentis]ENO86298.1 permease YjgP/YjgQ family protein [Thauera linaloolentis 47Lol = DSM 12138]MCM8567533.1 LPS export ABC transporter permease LptG [Thauera linaloolentis]